MRIDRIKFVAEVTRQDLTLTQLAEKAGLNRVTLSDVKNGKSCREDTALKIARALRVKVEDLLED